MSHNKGQQEEVVAAVGALNDDRMPLTMSSAAAPGGVMSSSMSVSSSVHRHPLAVKTMTFDFSAGPVEDETCQQQQVETNRANAGGSGSGSDDSPSQGLAAQHASSRPHHTRVTFEVLAKYEMEGVLGAGGVGYVVEATETLPIDPTVSSLLAALSSAAAAEEEASSPMSNNCSSNGAADSLRFSPAPEQGLDHEEVSKNATITPSAVADRQLRKEKRKEQREHQRQNADECPTSRRVRTMRSEKLSGLGLTVHVDPAQAVGEAGGFEDSTNNTTDSESPPYSRSGSSTGSTSVVSSDCVATSSTLMAATMVGPTQSMTPPNQSDLSVSHSRTTSNQSYLSTDEEEAGSSLVTAGDKKQVRSSSATTTSPFAIALAREELEEASRRKVAIKKIPFLFDHGPRKWLCAVREVEIMRRLQHPNIMPALDVFVPLGGHNHLTREELQRRRENFNEVYVVMDKMANSLRGLLDDEDTVPRVELTRGDVRQALSADARNFILFQLLLGVGYLHRCGIQHRDMKPDNILLDEEWNTKVCDFSHGRGFGEGFCGTTMRNCCTQWYAAPETMDFSDDPAAPESTHVRKATFHSADVWSIGCIAAEMLIGKPLFETERAGPAQHLWRVMQLKGAPPNAEEVEELTAGMCSKGTAAFKKLVAKFTEHNEASSQTEQPTAPSLLEQVLLSPLSEEGVDESSTKCERTPTEKLEVDLLLRMLDYNPKKRPTIDELLASEYFRDFVSAPEFTEALQTPPPPPATLRRVVDTDSVICEAHARLALWDAFIHFHPEVTELFDALLESP